MNRMPQNSNLSQLIQLVRQDAPTRPKTAMDKLMDKLFGKESSYKARYYLARSCDEDLREGLMLQEEEEQALLKKKNIEKFTIYETFPKILSFLLSLVADFAFTNAIALFLNSLRSNLDSAESISGMVLDREKNEVFQVLTHSQVWEFLAPHDILSLWQSCSTCWKCVPCGRRKKAAMLPSVFRYFKISEEAAVRVDEKTAGGWNAFLPVMLQVSQKFSKFYHHLEPDPSHRTFVGEQVCFFEEGHNVYTCMGKLGCYEQSLQNRGFYSQFISSEALHKKEPPPKLVFLWERGHGEQYELSFLNWGQSHSYQEKFYGVPRPRFTEVINAFNTQNRDWMKENAHLAPHKHYKERVSKGLHPLIIVGEARDTESGVYEYALGIGPNLEQFLVKQYSSIERQEGKDPKCFYYCAKANDDDYRYRGGMIGYLLGYPLSDRDDFAERFDIDQWEPKPTLGIAIWAMRHGFEPLTDPSIDWERIIEEVCNEMGQRDTNSKERDEARDFYMDALVSPLYGSANIEKWRKKLLQGSSPATIQWFRQNEERFTIDEKIPCEITWSSFNDTMEGLENCFLFLDYASWSLDGPAANEVGRDFSKLIYGNNDIQKKLFPNAQFIRISYDDWEPRHTAFKRWWKKQYPTATQRDVDKYDEEDYLRYRYKYKWHEGLPQFVHCSYGKIMSVVVNSSSSFRNDEAPMDIAQCLRLLYLFSFMDQKYGTENHRRGDRVHVPPHKSKECIIPALEPIAALHSEGKYLVVERGGSHGELLERYERFPSSR